MKQKKEVTIVLTQLFEQRVVEQAKKMIEKGVDKEVFSDEQKKFDGVVIFIDKKPDFPLFTFGFPEDFPQGIGKKIYVGNN